VLPGANRSQAGGHRPDTARAISAA
jgi:hypothetical protein